MSEQAQLPITPEHGMPSTPTGHARVDAAIAELDQVASLASRDRVAVYTATHQVLHETLRTIEER
jgi:hypothetical protein